VDKTRWMEPEVDNTVDEGRENRFLSPCPRSAI
jgi:hypothetical protein